MKLARLPFLLAGAFCLVAAIGAGLARLGIALPAPDPSLHGMLMVSGFFGTVIGLERAVAHGAAWSYAAPLTAALAGLLAFTTLGSRAAWVAAASGALFTVVSAALARRQIADFTLVLVLAGLAWTLGNLSLALGLGSARVLPWFIAFLVLTIFAERRELGRVLAPGPSAGVAFSLVVAVVSAGAIAAGAGLDPSRRVLASGLGGMALWLARFDVARHTVKRRGLTRFMAVALLAGYVWLALAAALAFHAGADAAGARFDAFVHALMLGFVFSMVFAHAPVIVPAVLGTPLPYSPLFYGHLGLLSLALLVRVIGDLSGLAGWRSAGGVGNALAIVLFVAASAFAAVRARKRA